MINFSAISQNSILGRIARMFLKIVPSGSRVFILQGRLRGKKWIKGSGVNGYWLGAYEPEKQKLFEKILKRGDVVFDIGAHVGFYTLLASESVGENGKVFSFEPLPRNILYLKKHVLMNQCKNVIIIEAAVSEKKGIAFFEADENSFSGHLEKEGRFKVDTVAIDDLIDKRKIEPPNVVKIDIEGAELLALKGARSALKNYRPIIILATHSREIHGECLNFLKSLSYKFEPLTGDDISTTDEIVAYPD